MNKIFSHRYMVLMHMTSTLLQRYIVESKLNEIAQGESAKSIENNDEINSVVNVNGQSKKDDDLKIKFSENQINNATNLVEHLFKKIQTSESENLIQDKNLIEPNEIGKEVYLF